MLKKWLLEAVQRVPDGRQEKLVPTKAGIQSHNEAYFLRRSDEAIRCATKLGDCHASLATSAADGTL
jgi:hypothetical protein